MLYQEEKLYIIVKKKSNNMKSLFNLFSILLILQSCAPSLTQYQTASTLGENQKSYTLAVEGGSEEAILSYRFLRGINKDTDFGLGFGINHYRHVGVGLNVKKSLIKDKLALNIPIVVKGIGDTRFDFTPTILYTINPGNQKVKNTLSLQSISYYDGEFETGAVYLSHNWQLNLKKLFIYPEIGIEFYDSFYPKFGFAFTFKN